jgi:hypothetical protein
MRVNTSPLFELARVLVRFNHIASAAKLVGQWSLPAQEIPAELLRPNAVGISRAAELLEKLRRVSSQNCALGNRSSRRAKR